MFTEDIILFESQAGELLIISAWEDGFNGRQRLKVTENQTTV